MKATTEKAFGANLQSVFSNPCEKWQMKKLGEVCAIIGGGTPSKANTSFYGGDILWATVRDMKNDYLDDTEYKITLEAVQNSSTNIIPANNVIIATRVGLGKACFLKHNTAINQDLKALIPLNEKFLDVFYLFWWFKNISPKIVKAGTGATVQGVKIPFLQNLQIPVPPLPEQHRIVSILDEAFTEIDKAKKNTEENIKKNKELFEAKLQSVFANLGSDWKEDCIGNLCDLMTGGTPSRTEKEYFDDGDIPWLVSGDVNTKEIFDCEGRITELGMKNSNAKYLPINSVLIALNGQGKTRGTVAKLRMKATCNQSIVSIYPKDLKKINADYIYHNLNARYQEIRKITSDSGNDRRGLNMPLIKNIKVSYPSSLQEQLLLVQKFDKMQNERSNLELIYNQKLTQLEELKKSILKQAFEGKL